MKFVILGSSAAGYIDSTALNIIQEIAKDFTKRGMTLCLCGPGQNVVSCMTRSKVIELIGDANVFSSEHHAVSVCRGRLTENQERFPVRIHSGVDNSSNDAIEEGLVKVAEEDKEND